MTLRSSWAVVAFISALSFGQNANHFLASPDKKTGSELSKRSPSLTPHASLSKHEARTEKIQNEIFAMAQDFESGERSPDLIQQEISNIAGNTAPIRWSADHIKGPYKLTQIVSHIQNLDNHFEVLFLHTFSDRESNEDMVTHYTDRIYEADEKSIGASIVFSRLIEVQSGRPIFDSKSRAQYFFRLKGDDLSGNFRLRPPEGTYSIGPAGEGAFDPLSLLTQESGTFEQTGEYQYDIDVAGAPYVVTVVPRFTDLETLTIEVEYRAANSLITNTFILVYEEI